MQFYLGYNFRAVNNRALLWDVEGWMQNNNSQLVNHCRNNFGVGRGFDFIYNKFALSNTHKRMKYWLCIRRVFAFWSPCMLFHYKIHKLLRHERQWKLCSICSDAKKEDIWESRRDLFLLHDNQHQKASWKLMKSNLLLVSLFSSSLPFHCGISKINFENGIFSIVFSMAKN